MTMPAKHGLWLNQENCALPMANEPCQKHHEPALVRLEARARDRARGDHELLAQKRVLREELLARPERVFYEPDEKRRWPRRRPNGVVHPSHHAGDDDPWKSQKWDASSPSRKRGQHPRDCRDPAEPFKSCSARISARSCGGCDW